MFNCSRFMISALIAGVFLGSYTTNLSAGESAVDRLYREYGLRFSDTDVCTANWPSEKKCKSFVLFEVREDSEAYLAGLRPGHVSTYFPQHVQGDNKSLESYAEDVLYELPRARFRVRIYCEFNDLLIAFQNGAAPGDTFCGAKNGIPVMLGRTTAEAHIGLKIDDTGVVISLVEPSPASVSGIQIGDRLRNAAGVKDDLAGNLFLLENLFENVVRKGQTDFVQRQDTPVEVNVPRVSLGQFVDPALVQTELSKAEVQVFEELPELIRPFFTAIYGGQFVRAEFEKKTFYLKAYSTTLAAQVGETAYGQEVTAKYDSLVDASRFGPLLAQYALVKLNTSGNCGMPVKTIPYTETVIRTISDGFGVELSQSVVSQTDKSFDIDARFAPFVVNANQVSPRPRWSADIQNFIMKAGGCGSSILDKLEANFLAYQRY